MKRYYLFIFLLGAFCGCDDFLDVNEDPDQPVTSTPDYLLPPVIAYTATSTYDHGEETAYITQQLATLSGFNKYEDRWDYVTANRIGQWRRHYHDISANAVHTIAAAQRENATNYEGVARILYALSSLRTTDMFGDMPYSEALQGNPSPKYDNQPFIYEQIFLELEKGIELLEGTDPGTVRPMTASEDNIFAGDLDNWIRFGYAIKARALLHLTPNVNQNYTDVIEAANTALAGWNDVLFDYSTSTPTSNPYQINQWGSSAVKPEWDFMANILATSAPSTFFLEEVLHYDPVNHVVGDPRTPYLMKPNSEGEYLSVIPSTGKIASLLNEDYPDLYGSYITQDHAPMLIFREEELHFIKAEAFFNSGNKQEAYNSFLEGISVNMDRAGVPQQEKEDFLNSSFIPQDADDLLLRDIMMQKHVAMWLDGEVWVDMRRYDYDDQIYLNLQTPPNRAFYWEEGEWIERLPYDTETEEIYNKPELDRLGAYQNPEWLSEPVYWAK